jgi:hypothetical protein
MLTMAKFSVFSDRTAREKPQPLECFAASYQKPVEAAKLAIMK